MEPLLMVAIVLGVVIVCLGMVIMIRGKRRD